MQIGHIHGSNMVYKAPADMPECQDLHVRVTEDNGCRIITSAWFPSPDEVKRLADGQPIYLHIYGHGHPVVAMSVPVE